MGNRSVWQLDKLEIDEFETTRRQYSINICGLHVCHRKSYKEMKTHKIKRTDEIYETFCELGDQSIEGIFENFLVETHEECTCKKCNQAYYEHFSIQKK